MEHFLYLFFRCSILLEKIFFMRVVAIKRSDEADDKLKCKINSTNGGTFSNFAGKILVSFFLVHRAIIMSK